MLILIYYIWKDLKKFKPFYLFNGSKIYSGTQKNKQLILQYKLQSSIYCVVNDQVLVSVIASLE